MDIFTKSAQMYTIALSSLTDSLAITICRTVLDCPYKEKCKYSGAEFEEKGVKRTNGL